MRVLWIHGAEPGKTTWARKLGGPDALFVHPRQCTLAALRHVGLAASRTTVLILDDVDALHTDLVCHQPHICGIPLFVMPETVLVTAREKPDAHPRFVCPVLPSTVALVASIRGEHPDGIFEGMMIVARAFHTLSWLPRERLRFRLLTVERLARDFNIPLEVKMAICRLLLPQCRAS